MFTLLQNQCSRSPRKGVHVDPEYALHEGIVTHVGILDLDNHFANGSEDILKKLRLKDVVLHFSAGRNWHHRRQARSFLQMLPELVEAFSECDLLLYQAGADPHIDDPLGGWLTTKQLYERDTIVFETAKRIFLPVCWSLAGGYQQPFRRVLDLHDNTLRACANSFLLNQTGEA